MFVQLITHSYMFEYNCYAANSSLYLRMRIQAWPDVTAPSRVGVWRCRASLSGENEVAPVTNTFVCSRMRMQLCRTHPCCYGCVCNAANSSVHLRIWYAKRRRRPRTEGDGPARKKHIRIHRNAIAFIQNSPVKLRMCLQRCKHIRTFTNRFAALKTYP